jgi:hypothetical protein
MKKNKIKNKVCSLVITWSSAASVIEAGINPIQKTIGAIGFSSKNLRKQSSAAGEKWTGYFSRVKRICVSNQYAARGDGTLLAVPPLTAHLATIDRPPTLR